MKVGPLEIRDHSVLQDARPDRLLQLKVKARLLAARRVAMPGDEPAAPEGVPQGPGSVENSLSRRRLARARDAAAAVERGAVAGCAGALAMSVSTTAEMRLRDRPPSDAPARAIARIFGIEARGKRRKMQLSLAGHLVTSISIGAAAGGLRAAGVRPASANAAAFGMALLPEVVVVPALGATDSPWSWSGADWVVSVVHHGVYATTTGAAFALLERRGET